MVGEGGTSLQAPATSLTEEEGGVLGEKMCNSMVVLQGLQNMVDNKVGLREETTMDKKEVKKQEAEAAKEDNTTTVTDKNYGRTHPCE